MKRKKKHGGRVLALLYAVAVVVWLGVCGFALARDSMRHSRGQMERVALSPLDFDDQFGVYVPDDFAEEGWFVTTDPDPQLILRFPEGQAVGLFTFSGKAQNRGGGEMVLYYTTKQDAPFSEQHKLWARQLADGRWYFDLGGRTLTALRFDPDSMGGVYWKDAAMVLNETKPWPLYFVPDALETALLLGMPLLAWAVLGEVGAFLRPLFARRQLEERWQQRAKAQQKNGVKKAANGAGAAEQAGRRAAKADRPVGPVKLPPQTAKLEQREMEKPERLDAPADGDDRDGG